MTIHPYTVEPSHQRTDMEMILLILIVVFIVQVAAFINLAESQSAEKEILEKTKNQIIKKCPPHAWSYHPKTEKLVCTACGLVFNGSSEN